MQQIEFIRGGSNTILGNFAPGGIARCDDALAKHLVEEVGVARYVRPPDPKPITKRKVRK